jgi:hypothetical protein
MAWDEEKPKGTLNVSLVDDQVRADKTTVRQALGAEHDFNLLGTTTGEHAEGSGKGWVDVAANRALRDSSKGRLFIETDTNKAWYGDAADAWAEFSPRRNVIDLSLIGTVQSNSAAFINIPNVTLSITLRGGRLFIVASLTVEQLVAAHSGYLVLAVDGTPVTAATLGQAVIKYADGKTTVSLNRLVEDGDNGISLAAGAHTVTVQWKNEAGGTMELTNNLQVSMVAEEI